MCHEVISRATRVVGMLLNLGGGTRNTRSSQEFTGVFAPDPPRNRGLSDSTSFGKRGYFSVAICSRDGSGVWCEGYEGRCHKVQRNTLTPICFRRARLIPVTGGAFLWRHVGSLMQKWHKWWKACGA